MCPAALSHAWHVSPPVVGILGAMVPVWVGARPRGAAGREEELNAASHQCCKSGLCKEGFCSKVILVFADERQLRKHVC